MKDDIFIRNWERTSIGLLMFSWMKNSSFGISTTPSDLSSNMSQKIVKIPYPWWEKTLKRTYKNLIRFTMFLFEFLSECQKWTFHNQQMTGNVEFKVKTDLRVINKGLQIELDNKVNKATKYKLWIWLNPYQT